MSDVQTDFHVQGGGGGGDGRVEGIGRVGGEAPSDEREGGGIRVARRLLDYVEWLLIVLLVLGIPVLLALIRNLQGRIS